VVRCGDWGKNLSRGNGTDLFPKNRNVKRARKEWQLKERVGGKLHIPKEGLGERRGPDIRGRKKTIKHIQIYLDAGGGKIIRGKKKVEGGPEKSRYKKSQSAYLL